MVLGLKTIGKIVNTVLVKGPIGLANLIKHTLHNPQVIVQAV